MRSSRICSRAAITCLVAVGVGLTTAAVALADPSDMAQPDPAQPGAPTDSVQSAAVPDSDNADPAAVQACGTFAQVLDATSTYYGDFADAIEGNSAPDYGDPSVSSSNTVGRTALRQGAGAAMTAANTPGLSPEIADPMRNWSLGATKLLLKMGLRGSGDSLNTTANQLNDNAIAAQQGCAAAGTHA